MTLLNNFETMPWVELAASKPIDPYLVWCLKTEFRTLRQNGKPPPRLNFIAELEKGFLLDPFIGESAFGNWEMPATNQSAELKLLASSGFTFLKEAFSFAADKRPTNINTSVDRSPAYTTEFNGRLPSFVTLRLIFDGLSPDAREEAIRQLVKSKSVSRVQLGYPRGATPDHFSGKDPQLTPMAPPPAVVLGTLEDSGPFAHAALLNHVDMTTRVVSIWDQSSRKKDGKNDPRRKQWRPAYRFSYGQQFSQSQMNSQLEKHRDGPEIDEEAVYEDPDVDMPELLTRVSHGAAVLSLMAGAGLATPRMPQYPDADGQMKWSDGGAGADPEPASVAPIVVVHLPTEQTAVYSGRWFAVNALDGLHYIVDQARKLTAPDSPPPLVVNVSYGAIAGPHDGSGMLESAIDELTDLYKQAGGEMAVVLAAGNTNGCLRDVDDDFRYVPSGIHAKANIAPKLPKTFNLYIPPDKQFETYVEIWFSRIVEYGNEASKVSITVTPPIGEPWRPVVCRDTLFWPEGEETQAGLLFYPKVPQGKDRSMALLVVAATQVSSSYVSAPVGVWKIDIAYEEEAQTAVALDVEAWIERDDTTTGARRPQSARFVVAEGDDDAVRPSDDNTLASIATGKSTFIAGSLVDCGADTDKVVAPYSASGDPDVKTPDFSAVTDCGYALRSIRVSGSQSGMVVRANGTSMAAPQAARWLAKQFAAKKSLTEIREELKGQPGNSTKPGAPNKGGKTLSHQQTL